MKGIPVQQEHYGRMVWVSPILEGLRHEECLCWNCAALKPGDPANCRTAQTLYEICVRDGVATPVTRCPAFRQKAA